MMKKRFHLKKRGEEEMSSTKCKILITLLSLCICIFSNIALANPIEDLIGHVEDEFVEVYDESGKYIFGSCMGVSEGDRYIDENNKEYEIIKVENNRATAKFKGDIDLLQGEKLLGSLESLPPIVQAENKDKKLGVYHTHSAESYTPGPAFSKGKGEIYQVGQELKNYFEQKGVKVLQSEDAFLPHDGGAYDRSRGTCASLLRGGADAVFDIHRDAIPRAGEYLAEVNGKKVSKVRIVVGRQNPNSGPNDQLAKRLKAIADKKYPGLIKGIFYAKGKYNQELSPRALLFEFGTHVTTVDQARSSAVMLGDSIYTMLYGGGGATGGGAAGTDRAQGNASWTNLLWIVGLLVVGGVVYLFINEGGLKGVSSRLKSFTGEEFANILGRIRKKTKRKK